MLERYEEDENLEKFKHPSSSLACCVPKLSNFMPSGMWRPKIWQISASINVFEGRFVAQAVSRWLPTAAARVRARVWSSGICGGRSGAGAGFLRVLQFPLPNFIPPNSPSS
jgi:hypothetical protein